MSHSDFGVLSDQAIAAAGVVYFLAVLAYLAQWAAGRRVDVPAEPVVAAAGVSSESVATPDGDVLTLTGGPIDVSGTASPSANLPAASAGGGAGPGDSAEYQMDLFGRIGLALTIVAAAVHLVAVVSRGLAADPVRVPWGNMYEFTLTGTCFVVLGYLLLYRRFRLAWLGPVVTAFVLIVLMADVLLLYEPVTPLRDALDSPWLVIHVVSALLATGAFTLGGMFSILYLIKQRHLEKGRSTTTGYLARVPEPARLDKLAYRVHAFAFPVWTFAVLIAGPIWAQHAWGRYWGWDPKETWAFITWVVYAAYLHARATAGWRGRAAALIAILGLATLWFNFIGINFFFGSGSMHSYAGFGALSIALR